MSNPIFAWLPLELIHRSSSVASREKTLRTRDFDEELLERLFYDDEDHSERELDELD